MNEKHLYTLLSVVKNNGDVKRLIREGLDYKDISEITSYAIEKNFIIYKNDTVTLSEMGVKLFIDLDKKLKITDKNKWIEKEKESRIVKMDKNFIFLPNQNELHF